MERRTVKKTVNRVKSTLKQVQGPAQKDQAAAPIGDAIRDFWARGMLTFSIPAHAGGRGPQPEFAQWAGLETAGADLPLSHGVDTRDRAWKVQNTAQQLFAEALGAKQTLFSTNGSSMSARVAIMTVAGPGETLVMARNGHKSSFSALVLSGAFPAYVDPVYDEELELAHVPRASDLAVALDSHPHAKAALAYTPSYYGTTADVRALADVCHDRALPLVTDDAWGLYNDLVDHPGLPNGALSEGTDLAIGSVHKTLSGLCQTSVLSVGSDRIDRERLQLCFELEESTSLSVLLLSSIDGARRQFVREGPELLERALSSAQLLRERLGSEVPELRVTSVDELTRLDGVQAADPTHVLIDTASIGLTGYQADDWLRDERKIDVELADHRRIMPLVTYAHGEGEIDRLVRALRDMVDAQGEDSGSQTDVAPLPSRGELRTEQAVSPREAFFADTENVNATDAVGRISSELVTPYPPGIPVAAPGEVYTEAIIDYLQEIVAAGGYVEGASDQTLDQVRVIAHHS